MRLLLLTYVMAGTLVVACQGDPSGPDIPPLVGQWCTQSQLAGSVTQATDGSWLITVGVNTTDYQDVRRSDGVVVRQEVRGCRVTTCTFVGTGTLSESEMLSRCRALAADVRP